MKKRNIITIGIILILIISATLLQKLYIEPNYHKRFIEYKIVNPKEGFIVYKNNHRSLTFCLSKFDEDSIYNKYAHISESEAFRKPEIDKYIHSRFMVTVDTYDKAEIGNKLEKLPNSNKCYLYKNDSVFRYNCLSIPKEIREIIAIDEWKENELGFWKVHFDRNFKIQIFAGIDNVLNEKFSLGNDINAFGNRYFNPAPERNYYAGLKFEL